MRKQRKAGSEKRKQRKTGSEKRKQREKIVRENIARKWSANIWCSEKIKKEESVNKRTKSQKEDIPFLFIAI